MPQTLHNLSIPSDALFDQEVCHKVLLFSQIHAQQSQSQYMPVQDAEITSYIKAKINFYFMEVLHQKA